MASTTAATPYTLPAQGNRVFDTGRAVSTRPEPCAITPAQDRAWTETRTAFLYNCPAFAHILYTLMSPTGEQAYFTKDVPIAAVDGINMFINPDTFFKYTVSERVFVVAHEVAHCIFGHCEMMHVLKARGFVGYPDGTKIPYSHEHMNQALDYFINAMLVDAKVGTFLKEGLYDKKYTTEMSAMDIYRDLHENGDSGGGQGFDLHLSPGTGGGKDATQATQDRNEQVWKTEVAAAMASARAQGKLPGAFERAFGELLEPQVSWQEHIQAIFARKIGSGSYDWRRPDRRLISRELDPVFAPGRSGYGADTIVVGVDTSGSINGPTLDLFFAEMGGILEDLRPRRLVVIWCDASVNRVDEVEDGSQLRELKRKGAPGGGGTAFEPVFTETGKLGLTPDCLVYLTDGLGSFPSSAPKYPTIWASIYSKPDAYPFGDVVMVPPVGKKQ